MTVDDFPEQPKHPEIDVDSQPVSESTVNGLVESMKAKMGSDDGWVGYFGNATVTVNPEDIVMHTGYVGSVLIPLEESQDAFRTTDYDIKLIPDGYTIEKRIDYDIFSAGAPTLKEVDDATENIRQLLEEQGIKLPERDIKDRIKTWLDVSLEYVQTNNPEKTDEAVTNFERELGLMLVSEAEARHLAYIIQNSTKVE